MELEQFEYRAGLVAEARTRSSAAWGKLYDAYSPTLYRSVLLPRVGSSAVAEDLLAETFRTAIEKIDQYSDARGSLFSWLATIARNKANDHHRQRARNLRGMVGLASEQEAGVMSPPNPEEELLEVSREAEDHLRLEQVLGRLHERYRRVLELRFFEGRSREDCAERLDVKIATFDVVLLRALRAFRKEWDALTSAPEVEHG